MKKQEQREQTDKVIFKEYIKLLKNDDKPTIIKLCSNAKINRETFYRHFETKQNFERMFVKYVFLKYNQISEDKNFLFNIRCYIEIIKQYKNIIVKLLNSPDIREEILNDIWDIAGNFVEDNTLTVYIKRIREKIGDKEGEIIQTVRGIGYRINE